MKPGRKVQIANLPLHLNITPEEIKEFVYDELIRHDLLDQDQRNIIKAVEVDTKKSAGVLLMESVEDAKRVQLLDGCKLVGYTLRISQYNDKTSQNGEMGVSTALANNAQISAKAAALAYVAFQSVSKKDTPTLTFTGEKGTG